MVNNTFYKLIEPVRAYFNDRTVSTWDVGEVMLFRTSEKKRHGTGIYPDRFISCTDGSMLAVSVIRELESQMNKKYIEEVK